MKKIIPIFSLAVLATLSACEQDLKLGAEAVVLRPNETINVNLSTSNCAWTTDNDFVAIVNGGVITAQHVGTTIITASENGQTCICTVHVVDKNNIFAEPVQAWGMAVGDFVDKYGMPDNYTTGQDTLIYEKDDYAYSYIFSAQGLEKAVISQTIPQTEFEQDSAFDERFNSYADDVQEWLNGRYLQMNSFFLNEKEENATSRIECAVQKPKIEILYNSL